MNKKIVYDLLTSEENRYNKPYVIDTGAKLSMEIVAKAIELSLLREVPNLFYTDATGYMNEDDPIVF